MDKKSGRSIQPLAKGANFDKKTQDNNGKLWAKGGCRRESTSSSLSTKPEVVRKKSHRFRTSDKRPRPRGQEDVVARDEAPCLDEEFAEFGSVYVPGSKKTNITHLTNFTFAPRNGVQRENGNRNHKNGNHCIKRQKNAKEYFLQANCQFVVNTSGDYKLHLSNPDAVVEWNYIEQINIQVNDFPLCPICRFPPAAAKITRCGHIFCWSCFLHFLAFSENSYQKCPICYEHVYKGDLKSVTVMKRRTFNIGETITFILMMRGENSLTPYPVKKEISEDGEQRIHVMIDEDSAPLEFSDNKPLKKYSKLLLAQNSDICAIVDREMRELEEQMEKAEKSEICFIKEAIRYNSEREGKVLVDMVEEVKLGETPPAKLKSVANTPTRVVEDRSDTQSSSKYIYFYQASDGQHIYIHSFNVKMLKHDYGSLKDAPTTITAKILSKESDYMSEGYRKCFKYLAHLPVTCPFETMEIEMGDTVVSQETLDFFSAEIGDRKKKRLKKAQDEKIRERRITEEENQKIYQKLPEVDIGLKSKVQFPCFFNSTPIPGLEIQTEVEETQASGSNWRNSGPTFAKMAASVKTPSNPWPEIKSAAIPIPQNTSRMTSLGFISGRRRYNSNCTVTSEEQDVTEQEFVPENRVTMGDAFPQTLQKSSQQEMTGLPCGGEKGKRKKKAKPIVILSNSSSYGYS